VCAPYTNLDKSTGDGGRRNPAASQAGRPRHNSRVHPIAATTQKGKRALSQNQTHLSKKKKIGVREETWSCPGQSAEPSRAADGEHQTGAPPAPLAQPHQTPIQPGALRHR
jgi:hypothetical protein